MNQLPGIQERDKEMRRSFPTRDDTFPHHRACSCWKPVGCHMSSHVPFFIKDLQQRARALHQADTASVHEPDRSCNSGQSNDSSVLARHRHFGEPLVVWIEYPHVLSHQ